MTNVTLLRSHTLKYTNSCNSHFFQLRSLFIRTYDVQRYKIILFCVKIFQGCHSDVVLHFIQVAVFLCLRRIMSDYAQLTHPINKHPRLHPGDLSGVCWRVSVCFIICCLCAQRLSICVLQQNTVCFRVCLSVKDGVPGPDGRRAGRQQDR